jgi:tetratricopeptide (TPR) repeat protein/transcriptional regulator with XRE-family HTH domain
MTQEQLATTSGAGLRTIRNIESGRIVRPRPSTVRLLADAFELHGSERGRFYRCAFLEGHQPAEIPKESQPVGGRGDAASPLLVSMHQPPRQLPADTAQFAGRKPELLRLDRLLSQSRRRSAVVISAIAGTAGVGKTTLAVHWAHRVASRFPDGQLYANLRGHHPGRLPMTPAEAIRGFLDALGIPPQRIPTSLDAQAALYRSLLAERRMLILLDNAACSEQVRPLLPASPTCLVLVTSRHDLTSLNALEGAHPITLELLTPAEARQLLTQRLGAHRVDAEPHAVEQIITGCARLPLALAIVAARATAHPSFPLATIADQLRQARTRLGALTGQEATADMRAVFSSSYHRLRPPAARLFRLAGLHPGPEISTPAVASLTNLPPSQLPPLLAELTGAHLLVEHTPGRYSLHDLLRAYATEQAHHHDSDQQRHTATVRTLDHYLHSAHTAAWLLNPTRDPITLAPPQPGTTPELPADHAQALAWFTTEHPVLLAAVNHAAGTGLHTHTWQLAWTLANFLSRRGHWHDYAATQRAAVAAARQLADITTEARAHRYLGQAYTRQGCFDDAHTHLRNALDLASEVGDHIEQAHAYLILGEMWERQRRYAEALDQARKALGLYQAIGHRVGQANALNAIGWCHAQLGDHRQALTHCQQALSLDLDLGDRSGQAGTWDSLGYAHHHLGHHAQAITCYQQAVQLFRDLSELYREASTLTRLGDTHQAAGNPGAANDAWHHALTILTQLDHPDATHVQAKLQQLPDTEAGDLNKARD